MLKNLRSRQDGSGWIDSTVMFGRAFCIAERIDSSGLSRSIELMVGRLSVRTTGDIWRREASHLVEHDSPGMDRSPFEG